MNIIDLNASAPTEEILHKIFEFERLFTYPLSQDTYFRIDHGRDYTAFYRSMGQAKTLVVILNENVIAIVSMVIRNIQINNDFQKILYIGDLKIHPSYRSTRVLFNLAKMIQKQFSATVQYAYSIVMDGQKLLRKFIQVDWAFHNLNQ